MTPDNQPDRNPASRPRAPKADPGDYASSPEQAPGTAQAAARRPQFERERLSNDYDEEPVARRRPAVAAGAGGGKLSSMFGQDPATRKLVGGAVGIGAVLLLVVGGWTFMGGHQSGIPIIGPPPGPVKDRPADPGGMQIMGGEGGETDMTGNGEAHLAPGPEQPDEKALARQYGVTPGTVAPPPANPAAGASPTTTGQVADGSVPQTPSGQTASSQAPTPDVSASQSAPQTNGAPPPSSAPETPAPTATASPDAAQPAVKAPPARSDDSAPPAPPPKKKDVAKPPARQTERPLPPPVPPSDAVAPNASGTREVQLGALDSEAAARKEWDSLRHQAPGLFAGHSPMFEKITRGERTFVRLRVGGFQDLKAARAYCVKLHAQSIACTPAQF